MNTIHRKAFCGFVLAAALVFSVCEADAEAQSYNAGGGNASVKYSAAVGNGAKAFGNF